MDKREHLCTVGGIIYHCIHYGKQYGQELKFNYHMIQQFHFWFKKGYEKSTSKRYMHPHIPCSIIYNRWDMKTT